MQKISTNVLTTYFVILHAAIAGTHTIAAIYISRWAPTFCVFVSAVHKPIIVFCFSLAWQSLGTQWSESRVGSRESLVEKWRGWLWPQRPVCTSGHFRYKYFLFSTFGHYTCEQHFQTRFRTVLSATAFVQYFRHCFCSLYFRPQLKLYTSALWFRSLFSFNMFGIKLTISTVGTSHMFI